MNERATEIDQMFSSFIIGVYKLFNALATSRARARVCATDLDVHWLQCAFDQFTNEMLAKLMTRVQYRLMSKQSIESGCEWRIDVCVCASSYVHTV